MKIHARPTLALLAALVIAGCGKSITGAGKLDPQATAPRAQHVDNPGQTPMKD